MPVMRLDRWLAMPWLLLSLVAGCSSMPSDKPIPSSTTSNEFTALVAHVDAANHIITLSDEEGNEQAYLVSQDVTDIEAIKQGDRVHVEKAEQVALVLEPPEPTASGGLNTDEENVRVPVGYGEHDRRRVIVTKVPATIQRLDLQAGLLHLVDPEGEIRVMSLDTEQPPPDVRAGDVVTVTYTDAIRAEVIGTQ